MIKKYLAILPPVIFLILILGVGYLLWGPPEANPAPLPSATTTPSVSTPTPLATPPATPTEIVIVLASPSPIISVTSSVSPTPNSTPVSSKTANPTKIINPTQNPTPTPVIGVVNIANLNVRWGSGTDYGFVGAVYKNDKVIILGRNSSGDWLKVQTPQERSGWVVAKYIETPVEVGSLTLLPAPPLPPSAPGTSIGTPQPINFRRGINIQGRSISGKLAPYEEQWYTFLEQDPETVVAFIFKPNVNFYGDHFVGYNVKFFLHDQNQIPAWPPGNADSLPNIGAGQQPAKDRDGDLGSGELIWRGGPLVPNVRYYLRFVNKTPETIEYCLAPGDIYEWSCPQN